MHFHQMCKCTSYILGGKHVASNCVVVFHFPSVCVLMSISFQPTLYLARVNQLHICNCLQGKTLKKYWLSMSLHMLQLGCNYLD